MKLKDASLLGKTGRCPKCAHRFLLENPAEDEVQMELVEAPAPIVRSQGAQPKVGTSAQWVPDAPGGHATTLPQLTSETPALPLSIPIGVAGSDPLSRLKRKRRKRSLPQLVVMCCGLAVLLAGAAWGWQNYGNALTAPGPSKLAGKKNGKPPAPADNAGEQAVEDDMGMDVGENGNELGRPTAGKPIELLWIPSGARIVINLRPAELWKAGELGEGEFIAGLGPLGLWMASQMESFVFAKPSQIEELLVCLIPGARGTPPDVAVVVRRLPDQKFKKSELIEKFAGQAIETGPVKYYANEKWAMVLRPDMQTYAIGPASMAAEITRSSENPNPTDTGIEELLAKTDRKLHFTVLCTPTDLKIHGEFLAPPNAQVFLQSIADWIANDDEAEAVAFSFHLTPNQFFAQMLARNSAIVKTPKLAKSFQSRLESTPQRILETIRLMNPQQIGPRKVIGRVPAMTKVVQLGTKFQTGNRLVSMTFAGPERAGPNLALGTLLAWDESTRTNLDGSAASGTTVATTQVKKSLKELLKTKIDVDFRRSPLEDAFLYIAGEAKFDLYVDGDALKAAGYTKNMPQTFQDESITASAALAKIISTGKYDKMCFVIDESKNLVTVTTRQKAEDTKLTIYEMK